MRIVSILIVLFVASSTAGFGQKVNESLENDGKTLDERYQIMKENSETYGEYKVIRRYVLDGVWKIVTDSIKAKKILLSEANTSIAKLEGELGQINDTIAKKDQAIASMQHDSEHISVIGIDLPKGAFKVVVGIVILGLFALIGVLFTRLRWVNASVREKTEMANMLTTEFEDYKRKALEKQMKLSRDLQTERNKLQELRN